MYIGDYYNEKIRKVDTSGNISTVAGTGERGYSGDGGLATAATLYYPSVLTVDKSGNIYFCDSSNDAIRKIWKSGIITTIAGTGVQGYSAPSTGTEAHLYAPYGVVLDSLNNLYITDTWNYVIRKLDASYHTLTGIPSNSNVGTTTMTLTASDGQGGSATQSFALKVINTNDAPVLASVTNVTTNEDTAKTVTLSGTDVDGDALTYTGKSNTDKVTVSISSTTMTLTPAADWYGTASITAYVSDGTVKDSTSFTLTVASISDVAAINTTTIAEDTSATVTLSSTFSGTPTTYSAKSDTSAITVSVSSTTLQLTPSSNWNGTSTITAYASVGTFKDSTTFTLSVTAVNDAPVITAV
ncbi:MAG: Ig-like domain-containing protein, partial [Anaerolineales bacterium]|nr:Ig-like domain-containing protein [Anaerolineales bacterium]